MTSLDRDGRLSIAHLGAELRRAQVAERRVVAQQVGEALDGAERIALLPSVIPDVEVS